MKHIESSLNELPYDEFHRYRRELNRIKRKKNPANYLPELEKRVHKSKMQFETKKSAKPHPRFNRDLPIYDKKDEIISLIRSSQVIILSGDTGSGKTTQIPQYCLAAGRGLKGKIGCTQPRRIAAISVANRIADELGENIGRSVGYKIRFQEKTSPGAWIKVLTDGMLLAETQSDTWLNEYDTLIIDEAHERSLNIDFILGYLKTLLKKRQNLKVIITSATIDTNKFSQAFDGAPIIEVSGRTFPIDLQYMPPDEDEEKTPTEQAAAVIEDIVTGSHSGDVLVFLPTEQDIRECMTLMQGNLGSFCVLLPLYARLSSSEQKRVFDSFSQRKIILSTNIAETSLTVPGIKYVVDTGFARIARYSPGSRTTHLPIDKIARSSADQRKGRCGRIENGVCIRIYSEEDFLKRPEFTQPEILRSNLAEVILRMTSLKMKDISQFPFIDEPRRSGITDGYKALEELKALKRTKNKAGEREYLLTAEGRFMSSLPIDPRYGRILLEAQREGCLKEAVIIVSALSIQSIKDRPSEKAKEADACHGRFKHEKSDFISLLNMWDFLESLKKDKGSQNTVRKFCKNNFLNFRRYREWLDLNRQLLGALSDHDISLSSCRKKSEEEIYGAIHRSLLAGFLSGIALKKAKGAYQVAHNKEAFIFPGSGLFGCEPKWIISAESIKTSKLFLHRVAEIDVEWIEPLADHICKYSYLSPWYEDKSGQVMAMERVHLFGLPLIEPRAVPYGPINAVDAGQVFVREALVNPSPTMLKQASFLRKNRELYTRLSRVEHKLRKKVFLVGEEDVAAFYDARLSEICDRRMLFNEIKERGGEAFLLMKDSDLLTEMPDDNVEILFPDSLDFKEQEFKLKYQFDPGKPQDGVSIKVKEDELLSLKPSVLDWVVPGLFEEKVTLMLKNLPKHIRVKMIPVAETARNITANIPRDTEASLEVSLSEFIQKEKKIFIPPDQWNMEDLPDYLKMRLVITREDGHILKSGREKELLGYRRNVRSSGSALKQVKKKWEKEAAALWLFGDFPFVIKTGPRGLDEFYTALVPEAEGAALRVFQNREEALKLHVQGVAVLLRYALRKEIKSFKSALFLSPDLKKSLNLLGGRDKIEKLIWERIQNQLFRKAVYTEADYESLEKEAAHILYKTAEEAFQLIETLLYAWMVAKDRFSKMRQGLKIAISSDLLDRLHQKLDAFVADEFLLTCPETRLSQIPRYIKGIVLRAEKGMASSASDAAKTELFARMENRWIKINSDPGNWPSPEKKQKLEDFRWLLEEYALSIYAQEIKRPVKVSDKRLDSLLNDIITMI